MKRFLTMIAIALVSFGSISNCFGKFGLVRTVYSINAGINIGSGKIAKLFRTLLMIFPFSFAYWGASFLDLILFNLVEFWTDSNPVAMSEYNFDGTMTKEYGEGKEKIRLTYMKFGKEIKIQAQSKNGETTLFAFADKPGKLYQEKNNQLIEVQDYEGPIPVLSSKSI
jgi:hypothetical protein